MALKLTLNGEEYEVSIVRRKPHLVLLIDGREHEITALPQIGDGQRSLNIDGQPVDFAHAMLGDQQIVRLKGRTFNIGYVDPFSDASGGGGGHDELKAPMPGAVISVHCQPGETVARGQTLITIESMKLQTALPAPRDGIVAEIRRNEGQTFEKDEVIVVLEPETGKA